MSFINQGETDRENTAVGPDERDIPPVSAAEKAVARLKEEIVRYDTAAFDAEQAMWQAVKDMRHWKVLKELHEQLLADLLKEMR
jgi:hypothetical protein